MNKNRYFYRIIMRTVILFAFLSLTLIFSLSPAQGQNEGWATPINVSDSEANSSSPSLAVDPTGGVHLVWLEEFEQESTMVMYCKIEGYQCANPIDILVTPDTTDRGMINLKSDSQGNLHIAYTASHGIYYSSAPASLAGSAQNWSPLQDVIPFDYYISPCSLAIGPDDSPYIAFSIIDGPQRGVYYLFSRDWGEGWVEPILIYRSILNYVPIKPRITVDFGGGIHVVWTENDYDKDTYQALGVRYSNSSDGYIWSNPVSLADGPYDDLEIITGPEDEIYIAWSGTTPDRYKFFIWSEDNGVTWFPVYRSMIAGGYQGQPALVEDGDGRIHWLYIADDKKPITAEHPYNHHLYSSIFSNNPWSSPEVIYSDGIREDNLTNVSAVIAFGNELHVVFGNPLYRLDGDYQFDVFYVHKRLTGVQRFPQLHYTSTPVLSTPPTSLSTSTAMPTLLVNSAIRTKGIESPSFGVLVGTFFSIVLVGFIFITRQIRRR